MKLFKNLLGEPETPLADAIIGFVRAVEQGLLIHIASVRIDIEAMQNSLTAKDNALERRIEALEKNRIN